MMKDINKVLILVTLNLSLLYSWEINTHRAIDRCAIVNDKDCGRGDVAKNLHWFTENTGIKSESYYDEQLTGYTLPDGTKDITYFDYIINGEPYIGISTWNQTFSSYVYTDLIEAGTILEDSLWSGVTEHITSDGSIAKGYLLAGLLGAGMNAKDIYNSAQGRFNFHFYDAYTKDGLSNLPGTDNTNKTYGPNSSLIKWGFSSDSTKLYGLTGKEIEHKNNYNYKSALEYFKKGFIEKTSKDRKIFRAKMFVSIGYLLHLINDMNVPAHTRNDAHAPDDFEKWMREGKGKSKEDGFRIEGDTLSINCSSFIKDAIKQIPSAKKYSHSDDYAKKEAEFTGKHFFSEDSIHLDGTYKPITNLILPNFNNCKNGYISSLEDGKLATCRLAINIGNIFHPVKMKYNILGNNDYSVIEDNAKILIPRAVANAEGFVNYFFRGRMELREENGVFSIKNVSDKTLVATPETVTFRKGGAFAIYYDKSNDNNQRKMLYTFELKEDLPSGSEIKIPLSQLSQKYEEVKTVLTTDFTLVYEGDIGEEKGISVVKKLTTSSVKAEITSTTDSITLKWNSVPNAIGYTICKSESEITDGDECVKNGGKLLTTSKTEIKITDELKENTTYYFMVKENKEDLWNKQVSAELTPYLLFILPANASLDGYKLTATKGDTISFSSSNSYFSEYIKESNARSDEDVTYTLWYVDGETGKRTSVELTLDEESETFSFVMPSSSITPQNILNNINRSIGFPSVWESKDALPTLSSPNNLKIIATDKSITLKWDKVTNASVYKICMSESAITDGSKCTENGGKIIASTSTLKTISDGLKKDTTYYFRVRGLKSGYKSTWSKEVNAKLITIVEDSLELTIDNSDVKKGTAYVHISSSLVNSGTISFYDNGQVRELDDGTTEDGYVTLTSGRHIIQVCSTNTDGKKCSEEEIIIVAETVDIELYKKIPLEASSNGITNDGTNLIYGTTQGKLYSLNINTKESTFLIDLEERVSGLFYDKQTSLYYYSSVSSGNIYKVSIENMSRTKLYNLRFPDGLDYYKGNLYVVTNDQSGVLTILNTQGVKQGTLDTKIDDIVGISHTDKFLYILSEDGDIYQTNSTTGKSTKIFSNKGLFEQGNTSGGLEAITVLNNHIYVSYVNDSSIYLINVDLKDYE